MTNDEAILALRAELLRQNAALNDIDHALRSLGDVELEIPGTFLEELDAIATRCAPKATETLTGLRA